MDGYNKEAPGSALYVSAEMPFFTNSSLLDVADYLYKETNTKLLCIDEIHKYSNWEQELKNMADIYKSIKILFTGSSMIDIIHSKFDLSRRVTLHYLSGLSFREYLDVYYDYQLPVVSWSELISNHIAIADGLPVKKILKIFREYLASGYYFYFTALNTEYERFQTIENIVQKIIYEDISVRYVPSF
ncbi:MAG: AAA family ATPase [Coxiellaceae bacterium]|nr:AAA family ATPase [Coxiellaceae bacterium]